MMARIALAALVLLALPAGAQDGPAHLGVWLEDHRPALEGLLVVGVDRNACAAGAGLEPGDVVVSADGARVRRAADLVDALRRRGAGDEIEIRWRRDDEERRVMVRLEARPEGEPDRVLARVPERPGLETASASLARVEEACLAGDPSVVERESASLRCQIALLLATGKEALRASLWFCPMHPSVVAEEEGECSVCGMPLSRRTGEEERELSPEDLASLRAWRERGECYRSLARSGKAAPVNLFGARAGDMEELAREIERLVADLGADAFQVREEAAKALREHGSFARPYLQAATTAADQEVAWRARQLLESMAEEPSSSTARRRPCVVEVVEVQGELVRFRLLAGEVLASEAPIQALAVRAGAEADLVSLVGLESSSAQIREGTPPAPGDHLLWVYLTRDKEKER